MSNSLEAEKSTRQSSPRFPFISLAKAIERLEELRQAANFGYAPVAEVRKVWGYAPKSSGGDQTHAALRYYGLIEETGTGAARRVKISDLGAKYLRDERPDVQEELRRQMVQMPTAMKKLWELWKKDIPSDAIARSILKNDLGYSDTAANQILSVYRDNLVYFSSPSSAKLHPQKQPIEEQPNDFNEPFTLDVKVGDWVQYAPGGVLQFDKPKKVSWVGDGYCRVEGSMTGLPLADIESAKQSVNELNEEPKSEDPPWEVLLSGKRLQITADVDRKSLQKLKQVLNKYEEILDLMGD
ncbi:hypothetical protein [Ponticaulis koreensis]|uniref:hypothetical protein n=1 Tax=Ponticaulis koreensis TaxID=1123045 RepID=UPI0003B35A9A|nr:hypothetical protein [Ponticaulis koreensis]